MALRHSLSYVETPNHNAVISEPVSLGNNEPNQRLIIDPGYPMISKDEYLKNRFESLHSAGSYLEGGMIKSM